MITLDKLIKEEIKYLINLGFIRGIKIDDNYMELEMYIHSIDISKLPQFFYEYSIYLGNNAGIYFYEHLSKSKRIKILRYFRKVLRDIKHKEWRKISLSYMDVFYHSYEKVWQFKDMKIRIRKLITIETGQIRYRIDFIKNENEFIEINFKDNKNMEKLDDIAQKFELIINHYDEINKIVKNIVKEIILNNKNKVENFILNIEKERKNE
jgi:hypothetical protein